MKHSKIILDILDVKRRLNFLNPCHLLATGFGSGMFPLIPGTVGSLTAIPLWLFLRLLPWQFYLLAVIFSIYLGIYSCHHTAQSIGVHDHGCIVWDEFIGMWISLMVLPVNNCQWVLASFLCFRLLDTLKPWPISWFDRNIYGGIGIIIDDIVVGIIVSGIFYWIGDSWSLYEKL